MVTHQYNAPIGSIIHIRKPERWITVRESWLRMETGSLLLRRIEVLRPDGSYEAITPDELTPFIRPPFVLKQQPTFNLQTSS